MVHHLHPFVKLAVSGVMTVIALVLHSPVGLTLIAAFLTVVLFLARIRISWKSWVSISVLLSIISVLNYLATGSVRHAFAYTLRLTVFMASVPLFAATTAPPDLVRALSRLPLPSGLIVALLSVWRFFPVLSKEGREIMEANLIRDLRRRPKWRSWYRGFFIPLIFVMVEYAERISLTLEVRGFDPCGPRTCYRIPRAGFSDAVFLAAVVMVVLLAVSTEWMGL